MERFLLNFAILIVLARLSNEIITPDKYSKDSTQNIRYNEIIFKYYLP